MPRSRFIILLALFSSALPAYTSALALPDAHLLRMTAKGSDFRGGDRVPMTVEVRSAGDVPLPPVPVTLTVDDRPYAEWKLPSDLAPNQTASWTLTWTATRGSHLIVATVDPLNDVSESDETNNSTFINLGAGEAPEPFPWPPVIAGLLSFLVSAGAAVLLRRLLPSRPTRARRISTAAAGKPQSRVDERTGTQ